MLAHRPPARTEALRSDLSLPFGVMGVAESKGTNPLPFSGCQLREQIKNKDRPEAGSLARLSPPNPQDAPRVASPHS